MFSIPPSIVGRPAPNSSKSQLSSRRVAPNPTQNTFPLCRKKIPSILFAGATRPKSSKSQLTQGGSPRTPCKILSRCAVRKSPLYFLYGRPAPKSSKSQLTQGGSPRTPRKILSRCAVRKSPYTFCRGDPPQVFQIPTYSRRVAPNPTQKIHSHYNTGAYVKNQIKFSLPLRELLRFLRQRPCVRGLFRRIS